MQCTFPTVQCVFTGLTGDLQCLRNFCSFRPQQCDTNEHRRYIRCLRAPPGFQKYPSQWQIFLLAFTRSFSVSSKQGGYWKEISAGLGSTDTCWKWIGGDFFWYPLKIACGIKLIWISHKDCSTDGWHKWIFQQHLSLLILSPLYFESGVWPVAWSFFFFHKV